MGPPGRAATAAEVDVDALSDRLAVERLASGAKSVGETIFGAMARAG